MLAGVILLLSLLIYRRYIPYVGRSLAPSEPPSVILQMRNAYFVGTGDYVDFLSPSNRVRLANAGLYDTALQVIRDKATELVDELYERYLKDHPAPEDVEYYMCGPGVMNKAVIAMLQSLGVDRENILLDDFG